MSFGVLIHIELRVARELMMLSGSSFLKRWMAFLEEHADLRYPNITDLSSTAE